MVKNLENSVKVPLDHQAWKLQEDDRISIIQLHIEPGQSMEVHKNPVKVVFYVLQGAGILSIEDARLDLTEGDLVEVEKELDRGWRNTGEETLKLLVVKIL